MRVFAIGFRQHVELRQALEPPKAHTTRVSRPDIIEKVNGYRYDPQVGYSIPYQHPVKRKVRIVCVYHSGGKVIGTMTSSRFRTWSGVHVSNGSMYELPRDLARVAMEGEVFGGSGG